ncbi:MAG: NAD(P)H-binding protein [Acidobacteriaceae bacterium]|nr:NAD(P)H-binding protein [Acidobacteriaceae bacterium]
MKVLIFGASGRTGRELVRQAIEAGHDVTAFVRNPAAFTATEHLRIAAGDAHDPAAVNIAMIEQEAVLSALGGTISDEDLLPRSMENILAAMKRHSVPRLIVLGAAGAVESTLRRMPPLSHMIFRVFMGTLLKKPFKSQRAMQQLIRASDTDWTIVQPPRLVNDATIGRIRVDTDALPEKGFRISRAALASFMVAQLKSTEWVRREPCIAW